MSYEIVYDRKFLKVDDKIIPLALHGSNNCYQSTYNGRWKRERNWSPIYINSNAMIALTEDELMEKINSICDGEDYERFMRNGKWIKNKELITFFKNGIKLAKTIEEMNEEYYCGDLTGYFSIWSDECNGKQENLVKINSSDDLRQFLINAQIKLNEKDAKDTKECVYICLRFDSDNITPRVKKKKKAKERLTDYYAIYLKSSGGYLTRLTRGRMWSSHYTHMVKQFPTEKEALRYIKKYNLEYRFNETFDIQHIVA